jgi:adenylate kinase family enzyme
VVGTAGGGKTTMAIAVAERLGLPHLELDRVRYGSAWREVPDDQFLGSVTAWADRDEWVIDGNYSLVRDLLWARANVVVWIDLSLIVVLRRLLARTVGRLISREDLGNGNRERIGRVFGRRSILLWAIRSHGPLREEYERKCAAIRDSGVEVVRLRSPSDERDWLAHLNRRPKAT